MGGIGIPARPGAILLRAPAIGIQAVERDVQHAALGDHAAIHGKSAARTELTVALHRGGAIVVVAQRGVATETERRPVFQVDRSRVRLLAIGPLLQETAIAHGADADAVEGQRAPAAIAGGDAHVPGGGNRTTAREGDVGRIVVVIRHRQLPVVSHLARGRRGGQPEIEGALAQIQAAGHIQLRGGVHVDRRDGVVRLRRTVLPIVTGIQTASGVQCRPVLHGQCGQHGQVGIVGIGVAPRHADVPGKIHRPRPVQRQRGMHRLRIRVRHIQPAREAHVRVAARTDRQANVLVPLAGDVEAAPKLHTPIGRRRSQRQIVAGHAVCTQFLPFVIGRSPAEVQVVGHIHLPIAARRVERAAVSQAVGHVQARGPA